MFYKPKYCCNCGEKIERINWRTWTSRRFCQLCETDYAGREWAARLIVGFGLIFGIVGFAGYFQKSAEKPLKISASNLSSNAAQTKTNSTAAPNGGVSTRANANVRTLAQVAENPGEQSRGQAGASLTATAAAQKAQPETAKNQLNSAETIYFCGAATKKSTPCSRRMKGGGRCWQHAGQPAVLPPEKLIAVR